MTIKDFASIVLKIVEVIGLFILLFIIAPALISAESTVSVIFGFLIIAVALVLAWMFVVKQVTNFISSMKG